MNVKWLLGLGFVLLVLVLGYAFRGELGWGDLAGGGTEDESLRWAPLDPNASGEQGFEASVIDRSELEADREESPEEGPRESAPVAGAGIRGRLLDPEGSPVAHARVRVSRYSGPRGDRGGNGVFSFVLVGNQTRDEFESVLDTKVPRAGVIEGETETDDDGVFVIDGLRDRTSLQLDASHVEFLSPELPFQLRRDERLEFGDVRLQRGAHLQGVVLDARDRPWEGVALDPEGFRELLQTIHGDEGLRTDSEGRFDLGPIPPGESFLLKVMPSGVPTITQSVDPLFPGEVRVLPELRIIRDEAIVGRVVDGSGAGIEGVEVRAFPPRSDGRRRQRGQSLTERPAVSAADGRFAFHGLSEDRVSLTARQGERVARADDVERGSEDVVLRFAKDASLQGRIREEATGSAVGGASVQLLREDGGVLAETTADEEGGYVFAELGTGKRKVMAWGTRHLPKTTDVFELLAGGGSTQDVTLVPGGSLRLNVRAAVDDRPVPRAKVWIRKREKKAEPSGGNIQLNGQSLAFSTALSVDLEDLGGPVRQRGESGPPLIREGVTDDRGLVLFTGLEVAEYAILVVPEEHARARSQATLTDASGVAEHVVTVQAGGGLNMQVTRSSGEPVPFQKITVKSRGESKESYAYETDVRGVVGAEHLVAGSYVAHVGDGGNDFPFSPGGRVAEDGVQVEFEIVNGQTTDVTLTLKPRARLTVVVHEAGLPASGATVAVLRAREGEETPGDRLRWADQEVVDPTGRRVFDQLEPGAYWVAYQRHDRPLRDYQRIELAGEENRELYVTLPGGVVEGTVTDEHGGPLDRVRVSISRTLESSSMRGGFLVMSGDLGSGRPMFRTAGNGFAAWTDSSGRFRIDGVPAGTFFMRYEKPGFGTGHRRITMRVDDHEETRHRLSAAGRILGSLSTEDGKPLRGVTVHLFDDVVSDANAIASAWVSGNGKFQFDDLAAGTYRIELEIDAQQVEQHGLDPDVKPKRSADVGSGETIELPLRWAKKRG
ncbi:MAG: carboxypeptidase regulatory-like domain-containing protein [Planctomycetes bacterium]|nr:carboxypeptidase regulatory-like domain-containing protein [Planctomycetota bacterium]